MTENATPSTKPQAPPKRHLKNFLLDKKFQLTYALIMVGVAVVATSILIALIWIQANNANKVAERQFDDTKAMHEHQSKEILGLFNKQSAKTQEVFTQESTETKEVFKKKTKQATDVLALLQTQEEFKEMAETMLKEIEQNDAKDIKARDEEIKKKEELLKKEIETVRVKKEAQLKAAKEKMDRDMTEAAALRRQNDLREGPQRDGRPVQEGHRDPRRGHRGDARRSCQGGPREPQGRQGAQPRPPEKIIDRRRPRESRTASPSIRFFLEFTSSVGGRTSNQPGRRASAPQGARNVSPEPWCNRSGSPGRGSCA